MSLPSQAVGITLHVGKILKGALLITGTMIGGGMLALPLLTGAAGFWPASFIFFLSWLAMSITGIFIFEASQGKEANLISMAKQRLGPVGEMVTWVLYLFLFYCLMTAYVSGVSAFLKNSFAGVLTDVSALVVSVFIFLPLLYKGVKLAGTVNMLLIGGLVLSFLVFVFLGTPFIEGVFLAEAQWSLALAGLPVVFTSFSYQGTVPTVASYLNHDAKAVRLAIWLGTLIPFIIYLIWEALFLGLVPKHLLATATDAISPLKLVINHPHLELVGEWFAFFALFTSFIGVSLGLFDFLADGLKVNKKGVGKLKLSALVLGPPLVVNIIQPGLFLSALEVAGGIGCALLLGVIPTLLVWRDRSKWLTVPLILFFMFVVVLTLSL